MAKVGVAVGRRALVVAVTMPLWAGYLVKGYAWRAMLDPGGGVLEGGLRRHARLRHHGAIIVPRLPLAARTW